MHIRFALCTMLAATMLTAAAIGQELGPIKPIERRLPPLGIELPPEVAAKLTTRLVEVEQRLAALPGDTPNRADAAVLVKAVRFAVDLREFYDIKDIAKAERALDEAAARIEQLKAGKAPWLDVRGKTIVRGFVSAIDGSVQPYGVSIPASLDASKPAPMHVWLHGRNDKGTDVHFIDELTRDKCTWKSDKAIVVQPFGRHCIGFKGPGEVDVFEAIDGVDATWPIDRDRIALLGFSMGGAGAWHIGAHYADRFAVVHAGAGFVDTLRYLNIDPATVLATERTLWGVYDVPDYVRNLLNVPVIAYSGELDKQKASADIMEEAFAAEGHKLRRVIGAGMGHKYDDASLAEIHRFVDEAVAKGRNPMPDVVHLQTRTARYGRMHWIGIGSLVEAWRDARVDAKWLGDGRAEIATRNVSSIVIARRDLKSLVIDGQTLDPVPMFSEDAASLVRSDDGRWSRPDPYVTIKERRKWAHRQGPIDDVFNEPFLVVLPSGRSKNARVQRWVEFESQRFLQRWRELFRGEARVKLDREVDESDRIGLNLILWGDPDSNSVMRELIAQMPVRWDASKLELGNKAFEAATHVPLMIYPHNPKEHRIVRHYVVLNSGPTFRESHDRTNSLQNPKLGDWAIIDVTVDPDAERPGRIVESGFFDEDWKLPKK